MSTENVKMQKVDWSKTNSAMCKFFNDVEKDLSYDLDKRDVPVFVSTKPNPSAYALRELKKLGITISKPGANIFTARLSVNEIVQLMHRRFIVQVAKSEKSSLA